MSLIGWALVRQYTRDWVIPVLKKLKPDKFFMASHLRTIRGVTEVGLRCHIILLAARHKRAHPALTAASKAGTRFTYPEGMEG